MATDRIEGYPVSPQQRRLWLLHRTSAAYRVQSAVLLEGSLDRDALQGALRKLGRALRAITDLEALGERTLWVDCDVLQADGGTRCAAISGAYVAAARALGKAGLSRALVDSVAAVSVGVVGGERLLDLDYVEDSGAEVDVNVVRTGAGLLVEVQATAERAPFGRDDLDAMLDLADSGITIIREAQEAALDAAP